MTERFCAGHNRLEDLRLFDVSPTGHTARTCIHAQQEAKDRKNAQRRVKDATRRPPKARETKPQGEVSPHWRTRTVLLTEEQKTRQREFYDHLVSMEVWAYKGFAS